MSTYRISQLAACAGVPATTLRYYEREGLLPAARTSAGYRQYTDADRDRVKFIAAAKRLGLSLDEIRELLPVWAGGRCRDVRDGLRTTVAAHVTAADEGIADLQVFRDRLVAAVDHLRELPAQDGPCGPACSVPADPPPRPTAGTVEPPSAVIGCSLDAGEYYERLGEWARLLGAATVSALPDGGRVARLPADRAAEVARLVVDEQRCCPFLSFRLDFTGETVELVAHAAHGAEPLVAALFDREPADVEGCPC